MEYFEYRIYQVGGEADFSFYGESAPRTVIDQDSFIGVNRDSFKEHIRSMYGKEIKFARSKKMEDGQLYCIVVTNGPAEELGYLNETVEFTCDHCGKTFKKVKRYAQYDKLIDYYHFMLKDKTRYTYCSRSCREKHYEELRLEEMEMNDGIDIHEYINRSSYGDGYIYKITKRSTGEFYIGQTNSLPIFRWAQHLKTDRFPIDAIEDYVFEILETVKNKELLTDIEMKYIREYTQMYPLLILNKSGVSEQDRTQVNLFEKHE